jgi:WD40 repeat protein
VTLWNLSIHQEVATLKSYSTAVYELAFSGDGNILASGSADGTVRLWRAAPFAETDAPSGSPAPLH